jgi:hypothetical protein
LNTQHDYVTLSVTFADKKRINLTTARYAEKCSAQVGYDPEAMKRTFNAFAKTRHHVTKGGKFETIGQWMDHMRAVAEGATDPTHLATLFEAEVPSAAEVSKSKAAEAAQYAANEKMLADLIAKREAEKKAVPTPTPAEVIVKSPTSFTQEQLQAAFDKVKNKKDWKARIDARIFKSEEVVVLAAIAHFTGTAGYTLAHPTNNDKLIVRAAGYRAGPCGDK